MRSIMLAFGGLMFLFTAAASAAPYSPPPRQEASRASVVRADWEWHHRHWRHRRWEHNHWRYWN